MILHHIADRTHLFVEGAAALHAEILGHGDLDIPDIFTVPDRLEEGVGKAKVQQILHRFLAQVVIDAKDRGFLEHFVQGAIERLRTREIPAEGLLDDDSRIHRAAALLQPLHDAGEHAGRDGKVVNGAFCEPDDGFQFGKGLGRRVIAIDVAQQRGQLCKADFVEIAVVLDAVAGTLFELVQIPTGARHADDGYVEGASVHHLIQRGKDFLVCQISGGAKKHEGIGFCFDH